MKIHYNKLLTLQLHGLILVSSGIIFSAPVLGATDTTDAIYVKSQGQNIFALQMLKLQHQMCVKEKSMLKASRSRHPQLWPVTIKGIKKTRPNYSVDRALAPEPKWANVLITTEKEYFHGNSYAIYKHREKYKISKDGACKLIRESFDTAVIDDGINRYRVNVKKRTARQSVSRLALRKKYDKRVTTQMRHTLGNNAVRTNMINKTQLPATVKTLSSTMKKWGEEQIVNQTCEYIGINNNNKQCYLKGMHKYPYGLRKPIILKSVITFAKSKNIKRAVAFRRTKKFEKNVFQVPADYKIRR